MNQLTTHFSLEELTFSSVAARRGLDNTPPVWMIPILIETAQGMEQVRTLLGGCAIHIDSGYRSPQLNALVGGVQTSAHLQGTAVDFIPIGWDLNDAARAIAESSIEFDQVIREYGWIHISFAPAKRRQVMTKRSPTQPYEAGIVA